MKIAVIGGGSTYTPELLGGLIEQSARLGLTELALMDIRAERLDPVAAFCRRMVVRARADFRLTDTMSAEEAIEGATFVILQFRVGGQEARHEDILMGLKHGLIGQETTGVGGMAKALRTIPEALNVARIVRERAPGATILNFTNPSGIITAALSHHGGVPVVGLCNIPMETRMELAAALGVDAQRVELDYVGLNHLAWVRRVLVDGEDRLPSVIDVLAAGGGPKNIPEIDYPPEFLKALGALPSPYLRYFYATDLMLGELKAKKRTRAEEVMEIEDGLLAFYADLRNDVPPPLLSQRGGAWYSHAAVALMLGLLSPEPSVQVLNVVGRGAVPGFPEEAVVEIPCEVSRDGVVPLPVLPVAPELMGLMQAVNAYERLTVEAGVTGREDRALLALVAHPLVPSVAAAVSVLEDMRRRGLFRPAR